MGDLKELKKKHKELSEEYGEKYGSHDGSFECEELLNKLRAIEDTFRIFGKSVWDYKG
jgi:hypothetical protein